MLKLKNIVILSIFIIITLLSGCNSSTSTLAHIDSTEASEVGTVEQTTEQTEDQIIYISGLSESLKVADEYSVTEDGEIEK